MQMDIGLRFITGTYIDGAYCDSVRTLAWHYLTTPSGFAFDAITSIPFSWLDWDSLKVETFMRGRVVLLEQSTDLVNAR
jgi:hypothetical protein